MAKVIKKERGAREREREKKREKEKKKEMNLDRGNTMAEWGGEMA